MKYIELVTWVLFLSKIKSESNKMVPVEKWGVDVWIEIVVLEEQEKVKLRTAIDIVMFVKEKTNATDKIIIRTIILWMFSINRNCISLNDHTMIVKITARS